MRRWRADSESRPRKHATDWLDQVFHRGCDSSCIKDKSRGRSRSRNRLHRYLQHRQHPAYHWERQAVSIKGCTIASTADCTRGRCPFRHSQTVPAKHCWCTERLRQANCLYGVLGLETCKGRPSSLSVLQSNLQGFRERTLGNPIRRELPGSYRRSSSWPITVASTNGRAAPNRCKNRGTVFRTGQGRRESEGSACAAHHIPPGCTQTRLRRQAHGPVA